MVGTGGIIDTRLLNYTAAQLDAGMGYIAGKGYQQGGKPTDEGGALCKGKGPEYGYGGGGDKGGGKAQQNNDWTCPCSSMPWPLRLVGT